MTWWAGRTLALACIVGVCALLGRWLGTAAGGGGGGFGSVGGALVGIGIAAAVDAWRGLRLMRWLRGARSEPAPRDTGYWGEVGYRVERALRAAEAATLAEHERLTQFLAAIEASPNGVLLLDADGRIDWCSRVAAQHFSLDPARDLRQRVTNLVRAPAFVAYLQAGRFDDDAVVFNAAGGRTTLAVRVRPYGDGLRLVLSQDVTEAERADAMRRDFVANVSHEIRTPLTVLAGFVETLSNLPLGADERRRVLTLMQQQTARMQALVADLLTLARLEGSAPPGAERWVAVAPLLDRVRSDASVLSVGRHTIVIDIDPEAADDAVAGSHDELFSAVSNLLHNAVRYTPDGGRIVVRWRRRDDGGGEIDVVDTGPGIAREHLPRLAERFYRVDSSRSRDTGGTGLGLAIVKHVAQRHGGALEIDSVVGRGSTFRIAVPALRVRSTAPLGYDDGGAVVDR